MSSSKDAMWKRTNDIYCHEPLFEIKCQHCESKMFLRFSEIFTERSRLYGMRNAVNLVEYKCPRCSLCDRFFVDKDIDDGTPETFEGYLMDMLDVRDSVPYFMPPVEEWEKEHEEIKKRLEILGYV